MVGANDNVFDADIAEKTSNAVGIDIYYEGKRESGHSEDLISKTSSHLACAYEGDPNVSS